MVYFSIQNILTRYRTSTCITQSVEQIAFSTCLEYRSRLISIYISEFEVYGGVRESRYREGWRYIKISDISNVLIIR